MTFLRLEEFCITGSGGTPSRSNSEENYTDGRIPWVKSGELASGDVIHTEEFITDSGLRSSAAKLLEPGALLVAMYGATVGQVARLRIKAATNQAVCYILPDEKVCDRDYLFQLLRSLRPQLLAQRVGGGQPNISQGIIKSLSIPLPHKNGKPDLAEQKRIAAILDKADAIRRKRQQALRLTDDFLRSVFLDMFGDPITNPKGWPVKPLSEGVESFEGGKNVNPNDTDRRDGVRVLKVSAVTSGEYLESESKSFGEDFDVPRNYIVKNGDLLISRANTTELVGAVAYVWNTNGRAMLPDKLWRFVWSKPAKINPLFMLHMGRSDHFRKQLILRATGSSGSMKNIGKVKMLEIPIPLPPIDLQDRFAAIANKIQGEIANATSSLEEAESLFASLQQRAFRGEL